MTGRRIDSPFAENGGLIAEWPAPGDYWLMPDQGWFACTPDGRLAGLGNHTVTEHEDKTITVSPSILVSAGVGYGNITTTFKSYWHGYLERGVWRQV